MSESYKIRGAVPSDVEFILKTWGREMRRAYRAMPDRLFYHEFQKIMLALVSKSHARVICSATEPDFIAGFVVGTWHADAKTMVLHFAYLRPPLRRMGLCRAALEDMGYVWKEEIVATFWHPYLSRFGLGFLTYHPWAAFRLDP